MKGKTVFQREKLGTARIETSGIPTGEIPHTEREKSWVELCPHKNSYADLSELESGVLKR
jgi:hypothetical protein